MDITGILHVKSETQQVSDKFKKRDFVLRDESSQYTQYIQFQLCQDKVSLLDQYGIGDEIKVHFNLRGREWVNPKNESKYFNTLDVWRVESIKTGNNNPAQQNNDFNPNVIDDQDLPF